MLYTDILRLLSAADGLLGVDAAIWLPSPPSVPTLDSSS
jgi:hypothetical protein